MEISEAIVRSVRSYYKGKGFSKIEETTGKSVKYKKEYFDEIEEDMLPFKTDDVVEEGLETDVVEEEIIDEEVM